MRSFLINSYLFTIALLAIVLIAANAFFVAAEFSIIASRRDRLENLAKQGNRSATIALHATDELADVITTLQLGITVASLLLGTLVEPAIEESIEYLPFLHGLNHHLLTALSFTIALVIVSVLHIILGEIVPKNIALAGPEKVASLLLPPIVTLMKVTRPLTHFLEWLTRRLTQLVGVTSTSKLSYSVSAPQLQYMIDESRLEGLLDFDENIRLNRALHAPDRQVREVTIPLSHVRTISSRKQKVDVKDIVVATKETGYSRFPIVDADDVFLGYFHVKDILQFLIDGTASQAKLAITDIRPLSKLDDNTPIDDALEILRENGTHLSLVYHHETQNLLGLLAIEDLMEEFVGQIQDATHIDDGGPLDSPEN